MTSWQKNEELDLYSREYNSTVILKGTFLGKGTSKCNKIHTYKREGDKLIYMCSTKMFDVPFSSYF
jgi:hypothetical protein